MVEPEGVKGVKCSRARSHVKVRHADSRISVSYSVGRAGSRVREQTTPSTRKVSSGLHYEAVQVAPLKPCGSAFASPSEYIASPGHHSNSLSLIYLRPRPSQARKIHIMGWFALRCIGTSRPTGLQQNTHVLSTKAIVMMLEFAATVTGLGIHLRFGKWDNRPSTTPSNSTSDTLDLSLNTDGLYLAPAVTGIGIFLGGFTIIIVLPL